MRALEYWSVGTSEQANTRRTVFLRKPIVDNGTAASCVVPLASFTKPISIPIVGPTLRHV